MTNKMNLAMAAVAAGTINTEVALAEIPAQVNQTRNNVGLIVRGDSLGLSVNTSGIYLEATRNVETNDEQGGGLAYSFDNGLTIGGSYADKDSVGDERGLGAGYIYNLDNAYLGVAGKYTTFDANNSYVDATSYKAQVLGGYRLTDNLSIEAGLGAKSYESEGYTRETTSEGSLGLTYVEPNYSVKVSGTVNDFDQRIMATISIPFGGTNSTSSLNLGQNTLAQYLADSSFDNEIVRTKKATDTVNNLNTAPTGENFSVDALFTNTSSVDVTPHLSDVDGDLTLTATMVGSGVLGGDIVISNAQIVGNTASITVSSGIGNGYIDYQVDDGTDTNPTVYRITINNLNGF